MELNAFTKRLGTEQGRIAVGAPEDGTFAFMFGSLSEGQHESLEDGDYVAIAQSVDVTALSLLRVACSFRTPEDVPTGYRWKFSFLVDETEVATYYGSPGKTRVITDVAADVESLTGSQAVELRLSLEAE